MNRLLIALLLIAATASAQNEAVTIKAKDKTIVNPLVIFPSGKTLKCDGCTLIGFPGGTSGNLTDSGTDGITITGGTGAVLGSGTSISQHVADATHNGYLSSS